MNKPTRKKTGQKIVILLLLLLNILYISNIIYNTPKTYAQDDVKTHNAPKTIQATITSKTAVEVGKNIIMDGTKSLSPESSKVYHLWNFGDGGTSREKEVVHVYTKPGRYTVELEVSSSGLKDKVLKEIFVYTKIISLINDSEERNIRIQGLKTIAEQSGVLLKDLSSFSSFTKREELLDHITQEKEVFKNSETIIFWVDDIRLLGLIRDLQGIQKDILSLSGKNIVIISNQSINHILSITKNYFYNNYPSQLLITRPEAIDEVLLMDTEFLSGVLKERGYDVEIVTSDQLKKISPLHVFSRLINEAQKKGFPDDYVLIFLLLPIIILVVNIGKNFFGISTIKIGIPVLLSITYYFTGLIYGSLIFITVFIGSYLVKKFLKKYHLLPVAKSAITITLIITILFITLLLLSGFETIDIQRTPIYPILILILFMYEIVSIEKRSLLRNLGVVAEIMIIGSLAYLVITITSLQLLLLSYPEVIFFIILLNIPIGRYTGLTLKEYIRFKDVIFKEE